MSRLRSLAVAWYGSLLVGLLPVLMVGFTVSALANRLVFMGWGVAVAAVYVVVVRRGFEMAWFPARLAAGGLLVLAGGFALFGVLVARHGEDFDLGFRAVLPGLYHSLLTRPATSYALAGALALAGVVSLLLAYRRRSP